jgi:magnesium-transporting ATPase (P-type)
MITACTLGLMLAAEPAEDDIMQRPPRHPKKRLLGPFFYWRTFYVATIFIFFVLGSVAWINDMSEPRVVLQTFNTTIDGVVYTNSTNATVRAAPTGEQHAIAFNTLVFCEITYAFNCRFLHQSSLHPRVFYGNPFSWCCALVMVCLQMLITYVPGLNTFFDMEPMTGVSWGICFFFAIMCFFLVELEKYCSVRFAGTSKMCFDRFRKACCGCKCRCKMACCLNPDFEPGDDLPKKKVKIPAKFKQGASLRHIHEVTEPV